MSSSASPAATERLPSDSADRVAAPSALSAATVIMPTIIVEATTSMSVIPQRMELGVESGEQGVRCRSREPVDNGSAPSSTLAALRLVCDAYIDIIELCLAGVAVQGEEAIGGGRRRISWIGERALILVVDRQVHEVVLRHNGQPNADEF